MLRYERMARRFLATRLSRAGVQIGAENLCDAEVIGYLAGCCSRLRTTGSAKREAADLRSLLRFLYLKGIMATDLGPRRLALGRQVPPGRPGLRGRLERVRRSASCSTPPTRSLNYQLRKVTKARGHFPSDDAVVKLLWLATINTEDKRARERAGRRQATGKRSDQPARLVEGQRVMGWREALNELDSA